MSDPKGHYCAGIYHQLVQPSSMEDDVPNDRPVNINYWKMVVRLV